MEHGWENMLAHTLSQWSEVLSPCVSVLPDGRLFPVAVIASSPGRPPTPAFCLGVELPAVQPPEADAQQSCFMKYRLITPTTARVDGTCSYLFVLALVVLQGGQVRQVTLQSLDTLLVFSLQLRLLLALFLQVVDVFVSTADLHKT